MAVGDSVEELKPVDDVVSLNTLKKENKERPGA